MTLTLRALKVRSTTPARLAALVATLLLALPGAMAATPAEVLAAYEAQAKTAGVPERGQKLFNTNFGREMGFSCSSCHTENPARNGKDQVTEKRIPALAPAANPQRFTDRSKVEYWFRLNCRDVVGRECTAGEKADVISWLLTQKP